MFTNAKNPRWSDTNHTSIILDVRFTGEDDYSPFVASPSDCTTHGPMLFNFASNGLFGPVADSDVERIASGELPAPEGHVVDGGILRPMTEVEQFEEGLLERPGVRVVGGEFVPMSLMEQLDAGQIAQEDYDQRMAADNNAELQQRLAELQTPEVLAQAEVDEAFAAERKAKLAALLAVKEQRGWPVEVLWP